VKNETARKHAYSTIQASNTRPSNSPPKEKISTVEERDRIQNLLFKYREDKIMREIEKIEDERRKAD